MKRKEWVFDMPHALRITRARQEFLRHVLPEFRSRMGLKTALDVGCGIGYFSEFLQEQGYEVVAVDGREENVQEARQRFPSIPFHCLNVEDRSILSLGTFDLVLCFGLLYHLENPFQAIRNFHGLTKKILLIESMCAPHQTTYLWLRDEGVSLDQGLHYVAFYPTETAIVKMCYKAGFPYVYRFAALPDHEDFKATVWRKRMRTIVAASKVKLDTPFLIYIPEPIVQGDPWITLLGRLRIPFMRVWRFLRKPTSEKIETIRRRLIPMRYQQR